MQFNWDTGNIDHIALHDVTPEEAEQVVENSPLEIGRVERKEELRIVHLGQTDAGRILLVAVTDRAELVRVVTAYPANRKFRKFYVEQKAMRDETDPENA